MDARSFDRISKIDGDRYDRAIALMILRLE